MQLSVPDKVAKTNRASITVSSRLKATGLEMQKNNNKVMLREKGLGAAFTQGLVRLTDRCTNGIVS